MQDLLRTRWAAVGAAVAVTLGAGGVSLTQAAISSGDKPVYVALDAPCRVIDTRLASPIGAGDAASLTVQITGANGDCTGPLAVPADAVAVATNVTVIRPAGAPGGRSFFTVYPANVARPDTSNVNFVDGQAPTPNKVDVGLSNDGKIKIYNFQGTAHAAVDIFGYYINHTHDDRYYTKSHVDAALAAANARIDQLELAQPFATTAESNAITLLESTPADMVSLTLTAPVDGQVTVNSHASVAQESAGNDVQCVIFESSETTSFSSQYLQWFETDGDANDGTLNGTRVFDVTAGEHTFDLTCLEIGNGGVVYWRSLSEIFTPAP